MSNKTIVVNFASWEDRFRLGFERDLETADVTKVVMFYFDEYSEWTLENRDAVKAMCEKRGITLLPQSLQLNSPAVNWHTLCTVIGDVIATSSSDVLLDISTMPRETIWNVLWLLEIAKVSVSYRYHSPEEYSEDWLSRDPGPPRLVYKLSGLPTFSARTALVVTAGYDPQRVRQLISWYEPERIVIGLQSGTHFKQNRQNMDEYRAAFESEHDCSLFELDAYTADHGQGAIQAVLSELKATHNVVMSSLGPKATAIALYCIQRANPEAALAYAPSNQFNKEYSHGIGECLSGTLTALGHPQ